MTTLKKKDTLCRRWKNNCFVRFINRAPPENHPNLKRSLASFIDWRCTSGVSENCPNAGTLHLCNHINGGIPDVDEELLSGFTETVKNDGVLRMDLLWSMASYNTWFQLPSDSDEDSD
ncbi:hypothetical protein AGABI2DRAFT_194740 [Agaricus bisporus var. bisporus H97]|uniref:hypothetical protein n=1 Tax=Agaricus bisporus var. bisporus (strain H97 / ATCC MYA-4626 / FGSC 10389) TaxID=936046 RepID=UPI00029F7F78|nr:hypothetical protein AGABI2DRAFT_194740 [Agaricus bisporus var. bisporus H97]EKV43773.1 hypothetical protein AGABI2DRAFT_194740 [Agaricus bisporus var. bisporus H97]